MNRILLTTVAAIFVLTLAIATLATADEILQTTVTGTVDDVFSLEFYTEPGKVLYSTSVPFTNIDPTDEYNYAVHGHLSFSLLFYSLDLFHFSCCCIKNC